MSMVRFRTTHLAQAGIGSDKEEMVEAAEKIKSILRPVQPLRHAAGALGDCIANTAIEIGAI